MFWRKRQGRAQPSPASLSKPLLQLWGGDSLPEDLFRLLEPKQSALQGQTDVPIFRAEMDLRNAMQSLAFLSNTNVNSLPTLTAISLPGTATALFWTIHVFLQQKYSQPNLDNATHARDRDARLLFQQLAQVDLTSWFTESVDAIAFEDLPEGIRFSPGHPLAGKMYRKHPFNTKYYYPVTNYFPLLFEERERALLEILGDLGAAKIVIAPLKREDPSPPRGEEHQKVFTYPDRGDPKAIDPQKYPWLTCEPAWQSVVNERLNRGLLSTQFELDLDVMDLLKSQVQTIAQLIPELDSIMLPANYEEEILSQLLQTREVRVEFRHWQI